ncbi:MAG: hypothetical protein IPJ61_18795 [Tessaracoccus sp.]|jgi:hypothetical protein|uniref:hypothetical protein n=1 Tax=Tessaracoccus sp. TaxID=1971211 RepID=UPI001EB5ADE9|nr:hypothetical protein [Tessaracoccus sp.]MBK7823034.1 hypothetical protein [Tessaracoccus sp.]
MTTETIIADTKGALLTALRAYTRAERAGTCGEAANNLRIGQKQEQRAREAMRGVFAKQLEFRHWSPARKELFELVGLLPNAEMRAHLHRLNKCGITESQWAHRAAAERVDKTDSARERQYRKRRKKDR